MTFAIELALGILAGIVAGFAFFRLLWWSTEAAVGSAHPVAVVAASFAARSVMMVAVIGCALAYAPTAGIGSVVGFFVARRLVVGPVRKGLSCD